MSSDYNVERSEETTSVTGQNIYVKGFTIRDEEWHNSTGFEEVSKSDVHQIGWMDVAEGEIVTLIESNWDKSNIDPDKPDQNPSDIELVTKKPYRVVGFHMTESDDPFVFVVFLQGPEELVMVVFGGKSSDKETGVWKVESDEKIYEDPVGCGILSDAFIANMFGFEPDILSKRL